MSDGLIIALLLLCSGVVCVVVILVVLKRERAQDRRSRAAYLKEYAAKDKRREH